MQGNLEVCQPQEELLAAILLFQQLHQQVVVAAVQVELPRQITQGLAAALEVVEDRLGRLRSPGPSAETQEP